MWSGMFDDKKVSSEALKLYMSSSCSIGADGLALDGH